MQHAQRTKVITRARGVRLLCRAGRGGLLSAASHKDLGLGEQRRLAAKHCARPGVAAIEHAAAGRRLIRREIRFSRLTGPVRDNMAVATPADGILRNIAFRREAARDAVIFRARRGNMQACAGQLADKRLIGAKLPHLRLIFQHAYQIGTERCPFRPDTQRIHELRRDGDRRQRK